MTPRELMTDYLADDLVINIPGRSAFAGERRGKDQAVRYIQTVRERYRDGAIELELIDMLVSDERVALMVCERFHDGDGPPVEIRRANVYRVRDGKVVEVSIFEADQYVVDALLH
jgi:ketosteroid isomerase-like protein